MADWSGNVARVILGDMEVTFSPDVQARLDQLAQDCGVSSADWVQRAIEDRLAEVAETRAILDARYDEMVSGRVKAIPGDQVFAELREMTAARRAKFGR